MLSGSRGSDPRLEALYALSGMLDLLADPAKAKEQIAALTEATSKAQEAIAELREQRAAFVKDCSDKNRADLETASKIAKKEEDLAAREKALSEAQEKLTVANADLERRAQVQAEEEERVAVSHASEREAFDAEMGQERAGLAGDRQMFETEKKTDKATFARIMRDVTIREESLNSQDIALNSRAKDLDDREAKLDTREKSIVAAEEANKRRRQRLIEAAAIDT